jgi:hypothetical protein
MARTLEEIDADLATLETQFAVAKDRLVTVESRLSKIIKGLKALLKRLRPSLIEPDDAFDHWAARRRMDEIAARWWAFATEETDDLDNGD